MSFHEVDFFLGMLSCLLQIICFICRGYVHSAWFAGLWLWLQSSHESFDPPSHPGGLLPLDVHGPSFLLQWSCDMQWLSQACTHCLSLRLAVDSVPSPVCEKQPCASSLVLHCSHMSIWNYFIRHVDIYFECRNNSFLFRFGFHLKGLA